VTQLRWVQDPLNQHGYAALPKDPHHHTYRVYPSGGWWGYRREEGLSIGPLEIAPMEGQAPTVDAAKAKLEEDWLDLQRLLDWLNYMVANPPPA
jgi:hypothetical protein